MSGSGSYICWKCGAFKGRICSTANLETHLIELCEKCIIETRSFGNQLEGGAQGKPWTSSWGRVYKERTLVDREGDTKMSASKRSPSSSARVQDWCPSAPEGTSRDAVSQRKQRELSSLGANQRCFYLFLFFYFYFLFSLPRYREVSSPGKGLCHGSERQRKSVRTIVPWKHGHLDTIVNEPWVLLCQLRRKRKPPWMKLFLSLSVYYQCPNAAYIFMGWLCVNLIIFC